MLPVFCHKTKTKAYMKDLRHGSLQFCIYNELRCLRCSGPRAPFPARGLQVVGHGRPATMGRAQQRRTRDHLLQGMTTLPLIIQRGNTWLAPYITR